MMVMTASIVSQEDFYGCKEATTGAYDQRMADRIASFFSGCSKNKYAAKRRPIIINKSASPTAKLVQGILNKMTDANKTASIRKLEGIVAPDAFPDFFAQLTTAMCQQVSPTYMQLYLSALEHFASHPSYSLAAPPLLAQQLSRACADTSAFLTTMAGLADEAYIEFNRARRCMQRMCDLTAKCWSLSTVKPDRFIAQLSSVFVASLQDCSKELFIGAVLDQVNAMCLQNFFDPYSLQCIVQMLAACPFKRVQFLLDAVNLEKYSASNLF